MCSIFFLDGNECMLAVLAAVIVCLAELSYCTISAPSATVLVCRFRLRTFENGLALLKRALGALSVVMDSGFTFFGL